MKKLQKIREMFPIVQSKVFLNHAAMSPLPKPAIQAMQKFTKEFSETAAFRDDPNEPKKTFAKLVGATKDEIALVTNTSSGLNIAAHVLDYPSGSNIVTTDLEYPSVVYPWLGQRLGAKVRYVKNVNGKILLDDVEKAVDDNTVALAISHVEYANGFRHDLRALAEIAHKHGAYLIVDAIQSTGAIPIDVKRDNVDFLTAACYKWLLGPAGAGFLYVRKELIEKFEPPFIGWASVKPEVFETIDFWDIWTLKLSETASRFEVGCPSIHSLIGATASVQLLLDVGISNIEKRVLGLTSRLIEAVEERGLKLQTPEEPMCRSGIVNFLIDEPENRV
ncbi:aminotransferase class V-fold PLP-dependent enzyme, partial [Candidatus Bathyarchaeota archaeon]|nr:aminotransferase class V-fold PLP-dependent enzyme [Candidatus Bathyarchaeota archaeon]